ncbi:MAG: sugar phosphate isomerase/epimerase [Candidatus Omnitrophica bacterium]|nr:sugar phosphate isomerase/epimerase [Candidatus Omnitrophota bacterium]
MIQVGIFTGVFPHPLEERAKRIRGLGFNTVAVDEVRDLPLEEITPQLCKKIRDTYRDYNLPISVISGYTNLVSPDIEKRDKGLKRLHRILELAWELGTPYVATETGTFNTESDWVGHEKNHTEEGFNEFLKVTKEAVKIAEVNDSVLCLETYVQNVIGSIEECKRVFSEIPSPNLKLLLDPTNYFEIHNIDKMRETLDSIFDALSEKIVIAHAKDVKGGKSTTEARFEKKMGTEDEGLSFRGVGNIELPAPGLGELDYPYYLKRLVRVSPNIPLIIEHLTEEDVPRAKKFIDKMLIEVGA